MKKHIKLLTVLCLLLMAVFCFVSCFGDDTGDGGDGGSTDGAEQACTHEYTDVVTAPTCTAKGYTTHTCSKCGDVKKDTEVAAKGHDYKDTVTAPTCDKSGYTTHTCNACKDSYKDTYVPVKGHTWDAANATETYAACTTCTTRWNSSTGVGFIFGGVYKEGHGTVGYRIEGYEGTLPSSLVIPAFHEGKPVLEIDDSAFSDYLNDKDDGAANSVQSLRIPDTVVAIGDYAFADCEYLSSISLPDTLVRIGKNPFQGTKYIRDNFQTRSPMGNSYYYNKSVVLNNLYLIHADIESDDTEFDFPEGIRVIAGGAFDASGSIEELTIPESVIYIGCDALTSLSNLKTLNLHKTIQEFGWDVVNHGMGDQTLSIFTKFWNKGGRYVKYEGTKAEYEAIVGMDKFGGTLGVHIKFNQTISD